jgi:hypothetical protein
MNAPKINTMHRTLQRILRGMGWEVQGQLGGHYRPLLLVTCRPVTLKARCIRALFLWTLPDRQRIRVYEVDLSVPMDQKAWNRMRGEASWISCLALDCRRHQVVIHRPFPKASHADRECAYVFRYLGYFDTTPHTPPPTEAAREAEAAGY